MRLLLSITAQFGWNVHHLDIKSNFFNGILQEEVYVELPPCFL
jgi:hypothetical protein